MDKRFIFDYRKIQRHVLIILVSVFVGIFVISNLQKENEYYVVRLKKIESKFSELDRKVYLLKRYFQNEDYLKYKNKFDVGKRKTKKVSPRSFLENILIKNNLSLLSQEQKETKLTKHLIVQKIDQILEGKYESVIRYLSKIEENKSIIINAIDLKIKTDNELKLDPTLRLKATIMIYKVLDE